MAPNVGHDQLVVIRIDGMHCHQCELTIQKALGRCAGVHEVEVDFNSGQASVLFDRKQVTVQRLMETVNQAGYRASGFVQRQDEANPT